MTISDIVYSGLTSTKKLTSSSTPREFRRWKRKIDFVLSDARLKYVLSDPKPTTDPPPDSSSSSSSKVKSPLNQWLSDDERARSMILFAMDDLLFDVYGVQETAKQTMDSLSKMFAATTEYGNALHRLYSRCKLDEDTPMNEHLLWMRAMAIDIEHSGWSMPEESQKSAMMRSLPESWVGARLVMLASEQNLEDFMSTLRREGQMRML